MDIDYRFLRPDTFPEVHRTFVGAFADYSVDMSYLSAERLLGRAIKNGISFESSLGAYDGSEMVGFMLVGLDDEKKPASAFDIATGVVPSHRGRGVGRTMLARTCERLRSLGVSRLLLEVIQENEAAVRTYRAAGFEILRELACFELKLIEWAATPSGRQPSGVSAVSPTRADDSPTSESRDGVRQVPIQEVPASSLPTFEGDFEWQPSWESSIASILRVADEVVVYGAGDPEGAPDDLIGGAVYYPALSWVLGLIVRRTHRRQGVGTVLMRHLLDRIPANVPNVRILNIDHRDRGMRVFLERLGFRVYVKQYEMELIL